MSVTGERLLLEDIDHQLKLGSGDGVETKRLDAAGTTTSDANRTVWKIIPKGAAASIRLTSSSGYSSHLDMTDSTAVEFDQSVPAYGRWVGGLTITAGIADVCYLPDGQ